jgi:putative transposase
MWLGQGKAMCRPKKTASPFGFFNSSPEVIRLVVITYVRFPLSLRNVEHLLAERGFRHWRWHVDEVFVKINGETHYLWRAADHEGEILESCVTRKRANQPRCGSSKRR